MSGFTGFLLASCLSFVVVTAATTALAAAADELPRALIDGCVGCLRGLDFRAVRWCSHDGTACRPVTRGELVLLAHADLDGAQAPS